MGFFDKIKETAGMIIDSVEDSIENAGFPRNSGGYSQPYPQPVYAPQAPAPSPSASYSSFENVEQKFDRIFATEFSEYQLVKNAAPESVGISAPSPCRPYSYALLGGGKTAAVIMLTPHNRDRNAAFLNARAFAYNSNVKFLNFYTHFENEHNYVVSRIRNAL